MKTPTENGNSPIRRARVSIYQTELVAADDDDDDAPVGEELRTGHVYAGARRFRDVDVPGLDVFGNGRGCNSTSGFFVLQTLTTNGSGEITKLHAAFVQHCESPDAPALIGEIGFNA